MCFFFDGIFLLAFHITIKLLQDAEQYVIMNVLFSFDLPSSVVFGTKYI